MVFLLDKHKEPAGFTTEKHARLLIEKGRACVHTYFPFCIILKDRCVGEMENLQTFRVKIDPGSVHTGIAIVGNGDDRVYFYAKIEHRGGAVRAALFERGNNRSNRRSREMRYRRPKWGRNPAGKDGHRKYDSPRPEGWLPPSIKSVADNIIHWVEKLCRICNITKCSFEAVRFDPQLMDNPEIGGKEYQHGTLFGYELKEYLMEKYGHTCQYCMGESGDKILEWEHMFPKSRGGSDSVKNATLACSRCNSDKDNLTPEEWLEKLQAKKEKTELDKKRTDCLKNVIGGKQNGVSNRYSAWVNSYRRYVEKFLFARFGDGNVECSSGGRTKFNRETHKLPKDHHYDALMVGSVPEKGYKDLTNGYCLDIKAKGRGSRLRGNTNDCGVITVKYTDSAKRFKGFQSGDICVADVPKGKSKYSGHYAGRITIRKTGSFQMSRMDGGNNCVSYRYLRILQPTDGYAYKYDRPFAC